MGGPSGDESLPERGFGSGNRIFCAGHDLAEFQEHEAPAFDECVARECSAMMQTMRRLPQTVIARVDGMTEPQAYDFVCGQVREHIAHPDAKEGIGAFLEKRVPVWGQPPGQ